MARLLRSIPELMIMVKGMAAACRSVFFTLCLLAFLTYVFAIAFVQMTEGTQVGRQHFSTVFEAMYNLLLFGTFLDSAGLLANRLLKEHVFFVAVFFVFILFAALTVLNMLVGVLCEVVSAVAATEKEEMLVNYVHRKVKAIVEELDKDGDNSISKSEFVKILENWDAVQSLQDVGVDVVGLVDFADVIFEDGAQELSFEKFMDVVLQLRGTNTATVKDIVELRKMVRTNNIQTSHLLARIEGRILSQAPKPGHITPTLSTTSFESAELANAVTREMSDGIGVVMDSFPMPPLSSIPAQFMKHDGDNESLPSVENVCDAGRCVDLSKEREALCSRFGAYCEATKLKSIVDRHQRSVERNAGAPEKKIDGKQEFELRDCKLPCLKDEGSKLESSMQTQRDPCKPGEGVQVCRAMLNNIAFSGESHLSRVECLSLERGLASHRRDDTTPLPTNSQTKDGFDYGLAELFDLKKQMASLGNALSTRMYQLENACKLLECQQQSAPSLGCSASKTSDSLRLGRLAIHEAPALSTCGVCDANAVFAGNTCPEEVSSGAWFPCKPAGSYEL